MSAKGKKKSLRARIIITIGIVVTLAIYLMSTGANIMTMNLYKEQMSEIISSKLDECNGKLNAWLQQKTAFTEFIAQEVLSRGYLDDKDACRQFFLDCTARDEDIYDTYIGLPDSTVCFGSGWEPTVEELDPVTRGWYISAASSDGVVITDPYIDAQSGKLVITQCQSLNLNPSKCKIKRDIKIKKKFTLL